MRSYCLWVEQETAAVALVALAVSSASSCSEVLGKPYARVQGSQLTVGLTCSQSNWQIKVCVHRSSRLKNSEVGRQEGYPLSCVAGMLWNRQFTVVV